MKKSDFLVLSLVGLLSIQNLNAQSGNILTICGNGTAGYTGDGGQAALAELYNPEGLAEDSQGNIYVADYHNNRIRKITSLGVITTVAGNGIAGTSGDGGLATAAELHYPSSIALDANDNLYIADYEGFIIRKVDASTGIITTIAGYGGYGNDGDGGLATNAKLRYPVDLTFDSHGDLYFADQLSHVIRKVTISTGIITTVAGNGTGSFSGDGGLAINAEMYQPTGLVLDVNDNIYFTDKNNQRIRRVDATTGIITTIAGSSTAGYSGDGGLATAAELNSPCRIILDGNENIYFADAGNNRIRKIDKTTGIITTVIGTGVAGYTGDGGSAIAAELNTPIGILISASGNFYVSEFNNNCIREIKGAYAGIEQYSKEDKEIIIYPNPANDLVKLNLNAQANSAVQIKVIDLNGKEVIAKSLTTNSNGEVEAIDVKNVPSGTYFITVATTGISTSLKFIKQ